MAATMHPLLDAARIALQGKPSLVTDLILERVQLVQASKDLESIPHLHSRFAEAVALYRVGRAGEAGAIFLQVFRDAAVVGRGAARSSQLNAATCAVLDGKSLLAVELLQPLFNTGRLYGVVLWTLCLAYYRCHQLDNALTVVEVWLARAPDPVRSRGLLVAAAITNSIGASTKRDEFLNQAFA